MRDVRADADHVEIERAKGENVFGQALKGLAGNADHHAAARFVAEAFNLLAAASGGRARRQSAGDGWRDRDTRRRSRSAADSGPRLPCATAAARPARRSPRLSVTASGVSRLIQRTMPATHSAVSPIVFAGLHHDGAVAQPLRLAGAVENLFSRHAVALDARLARRRPQYMHCRSQ